MKQKILFILFFAIVLMTNSANAQYWSRWLNHGSAIGFSSDEKWVFFLQANDAGIENIFKIELKTNAVTPVTNFTERPVLSAISLFGKQPAIVFSRAATTAGNDIHLYRVNVMTTDPPVDFTKDPGPSYKQILGMAYNGSYVYYLSDRGAGSKTDIYRYDCAQYRIELAFANDKDYTPLCWSRDQTHMLLRDPKTLDVYNYSIETTDKQKINLPFSGSDLKTVFYDPMNTSYYMINEHNELYTCKVGATEKSDAVKVADEVAFADLSLYAKYIHTVKVKKINGGDEWEEKILDNPTKGFIDFPSGANHLIIGPKETSVLYIALSDDLKFKLYLYDIAKKTSKELTVIK